MSNITELTDKDQITLSVFNLLGMDVPLTELAMDYIGVDALNYQLFVRYYNINDLPEISDKVKAAIESAAKAKSIFK